MQKHDAYYAFHLFAGRFADDQQAQGFAFEQWEPEPDASASNAEYQAWEERNPSWRLEQELGFYMDSDFIELVSSQDCPQYLESLIRDDAQKQRLRSRVEPGHSHFIIVAQQSIYGDRQSTTSGAPQRQPSSTATLDYLGEFNGCPA